MVIFEFLFDKLLMARGDKYLIIMVESGREAYSSGSKWAPLNRIFFPEFHMSILVTTLDNREPLQSYG